MHDGAETTHPEQRAFPVHHRGHPRVLVETGDRALMISDFRFLTDAGFDVAVCSGPGEAPWRCPLRRGEGCELLFQADVVVQGLWTDLALASAIKTARPDLPVIVQHPRRRGLPIPDGCIPLDMPCSLQGQLQAVERAVACRSPAAGLGGPGPASQPAG